MAGVASTTLLEEIDPKSVGLQVKALVDTDSCHEAFWKLIHFLETFSGIVLPTSDFRITTAEDAQLVDTLKGHNKSDVMRAVKVYLGGQLSEQDMQLLTDRRNQLTKFGNLLRDESFFADELRGSGKARSEDVWQDFFEKNQWIMGYGLTLISCESLSSTRLEQITTGANIFTGGGKRSDIVMRTRGFISSLLFGEIKTHKTPLLKSSPYRPPDVYQVSDELAGGVSQVQKTAHKAVAKLDSLYRTYSPEGESLFDVVTIRPRQVLVIGSLQELTEGDTPNKEKLTSFELFRRAQSDVEIITYDELYERAKFIVQDHETEEGTETV